jgi:hypothetical protein
VARPAAVGREVDRGRDEPRVLNRLEDGRRAAAHVLVAHREDRVAEGLARADRAHGRERRAVLDDSPLAAVVPGEVRHAVDVGVRAGRDRRQADGRDRGKGRHPRSERPARGELGDRRNAALVECALEQRGRQPVDHDEDHLLARGGHGH